MHVQIAAIERESGIGYFTFPENEGQGIATEMVAQLIEMTRRTHPELIITAQTLNQENASNAILRKFGFQFVGECIDAKDGVAWQWERRAEKEADG